MDDVVVVLDFVDCIEVDVLVVFGGIGVDFVEVL